ncbi:hypothetical protein E2C01_013712 [Portunus trituberculatus]|uniref:Uncharacterized protein n=1 Tax=Portunus trituberculatus TaxID=210409 RepID=A0A5B7DI16_PORTR|nr:hypothetical protein [Portunus trituberculatus]
MHIYLCICDALFPLEASCKEVTMVEEPPAHAIQAFTSCWFKCSISNNTSFTPKPLLGLKHRPTTHTLPLARPRWGNHGSQTNVVGMRDSCITGTTTSHRSQEVSMSPHLTLLSFSAGHQRVNFLWVNIFHHQPLAGGAQKGDCGLVHVHPNAV